MILEIRETILIRGSASATSMVLTYAQFVIYNCIKRRCYPECIEKL